MNKLDKASLSEPDLSVIAPEVEWYADPVRASYKGMLRHGNQAYQITITHMELLLARNEAMIVEIVRRKVDNARRLLGMAGPDVGTMRREAVEGRIRGSWDPEPRSPPNLPPDRPPETPAERFAEDDTDFARRMKKP